MSEPSRLSALAAFPGNDLVTPARQTQKIDRIQHLPSAVLRSNFRIERRLAIIAGVVEVKFFKLKDFFMAYSIANVPLIPQTQNMACWYASAQMLIEWRRIRTQMCETAHPYPSQVAELESLFKANNGLPFTRNVELAKDLGLQPVPPMTPAPETIENWLRASGPLWFAGLFPSGHAVVITGITASEILINDPWPPNVGARRTLSYTQFGTILQPLRSGTGLAPNLLYFSD